MNISNLKFDINDVVKIIGFVIIAIGFRNDLVSEIRSNKVFDTADKQIINYRIEELEKYCSLAIKPKELAVETYKVN